MKKILFVATVYKKHIHVFHLPYIKWFVENEYLVDVAAKNDFVGSNISLDSNISNFYDIKFSRSPFSLQNIQALIKLKKIVINNQYDIIHCNTPVAGVLTRLVIPKKNKPKVIYTAHGFHFFKGSSILNWILYYPIEKLLSKKTDLLITMNSEDYKVSQQFKAKNTVKVNGVGFNLTQNNFISSENKKDELSILEYKYVITSVGELSKRKNHMQVLRVLRKLKDINYVYLICGEGKLKYKLYKYAKQNNINLHLLGFRSDVSEILSLSDIYIFPSLQEGLPVSLLEAMSKGIISIASNIRGNNDLIADGYNGYLYNSDKELYEKLKNVIYELKSLDNIQFNAVKTTEQYSITNVLIQMKEIYKTVMNND